MSKIKNWFADFKKFISKGNILDMAVGVIIGTAFSAIIKALVNNILMPLITTAIPGGLTGLVTVINPSEALLTAEQVASTPNTITYWGQVYNADIVNVINWGSFLDAVINFLIIALVMFIIVRAAMSFSKFSSQEKEINHAFTVKEKRAMRKEGKSYQEIRALAEKKVQDAKDQKAKEDLEAQSKIETELTVLKDIKDLLAKQEKAEK